MPRIIRSLAAACLLLLTFAPTARAQGVFWDLHGGLASSTITGDVAGSPNDRIGVHLGAGARIMVTEAFGMNTELNYIQRGLTRDEDDSNSQAISASGMTYKVDYWEFNGLLRLGLPAVGGFRPALLGGAGVGFKTNETLVVDGGTQAGTRETESLDGLDLTMILGVTMDLGDGDGRWFVDARWAKSMMSVADPIQFVGIETPDYRNRTLSIAIGRAFRVNGY